MLPFMRPAARVLVLGLSIAGAACQMAPVPTSSGPAVRQGAQPRFGPLAVPGVTGPRAQTEPGRPAEAWALEQSEVVTTADLMSRGSGVDRDRSAGSGLTKIRPDRSNLRQNPEAPAVAQWPPSPRFRQSGPAVAFSAATPNADVAFRSDTGNVTPPDTMGDVGPTQYLVALNGRVRTISKATGAADGVLDLDSNVFYGAAAQGEDTGDPRVRYDRRAGRWYVLMFNIAVPNRYLLAVSSTATITPSTTWTIWFWNNTRTQNGAGAVGCLGDYPTLGVDEDALYVGVNQFCGASITSLLTFDSTSVYVLPRVALLGGAGGAPSVFQFDGVLPNDASAGILTPQGVDNYDNGTNEGYVIGVDRLSYSLLVLRRISNPGTAPVLSDNVNVTVPTTGNTIDVPQPGGTARPIDGLGDRLMHAVIRNGALWTLHQIAVDATGVASASNQRNGQRWYQIGNLSTTPTLIQSGTVFDAAATNPASHWMGALMVNGQGHVAMGLTRGGLGAHLNTVFTGRLAGDAPGTMDPPTPYSNNTSTIYTLQGSGTQRWGDYSYTSVDPNDDMTMWTLQEYPNAANSYAVRLVRLVAPPPATIASLAPASVAAGQTAATVTVTGTSVAGSGFFDPGAGFPNRLAAAFDGTGVTVTSVAYNSPTSLTLTLNTVGASAGARTLTVTNPDGQQRSLAGALTIGGGGGGGSTTPTNFRVASMAGANVTFAWTLPTAGGTPTSLQIEGGTTPGSVLGVLPIGVTPSATVGLPTGSFYVRLRAIVGGVPSGASNEILVHVNVPVPPSAPVNLLGTAAGDALTLAWTPTFTGGEPLSTAIDVTGSAALSIPLGNVDTFSFAGVPGGTYTFAVRQVNAGGSSSASTPVTLTFPAGCTGVAQPPTNFMAYKSAGILYLLWDPPATGPAPSGYVLNVTGSFVGGLAMAGRSFTIGAPPGTYNLSLVSTNACGTGPATAPQTVSFP